MRDAPGIDELYHDREQSAEDAMSEVIEEAGREIAGLLREAAIEALADMGRNQGVKEADVMLDVLRHWITGAAVRLAHARIREVL